MEMQSDVSYSDSETSFDLEDLSEQQIHRIVAPNLRRAKRKSSSRTLRRLAAKYQTARAKCKEAVKYAREHYRRAAGPFPLLRRQASLLTKKADNARKKLCEAALTLLTVEDDLPRS
jgi:hypothetical protein